MFSIHLLTPREPWKKGHGIQNYVPRLPRSIINSWHEAMKIHRSSRQSLQCIPLLGVWGIPQSHTKKLTAYLCSATAIRGETHESGERLHTRVFSKKLSQNRSVSVKLSSHHVVVFKFRCLKGYRCLSPLLPFLRVQRVASMSDFVLGFFCSWLSFNWDIVCQ